MPVSTRQLLRWCYPNVARFETKHRVGMWRAAQRYAVKIKHGLRAPNAELLQRIGRRHSDSSQQQIIDAKHHM
jgi:hypothetical protein